MNKFAVILLVVFSVFLSACNLKGDSKTVDIEESVSPSVTIGENIYVPNDPVEVFLVELTKSTKVSFSTPEKSDIVWSEGETPETLKTFFGDAFLIKNPNPKAEDEKIVEEYFKNNGFEYMKFNESKGEDSHRVGYRKGSLVCKYDFSQYPEEETAHLIVFCGDADLSKANK